MSIDRTGWANIGGINYFLDEYQQVTERLLYGMDAGADCYYPLRHEKDFLAAYRACGPLKSIIGKRAKAFNTGELTYINPNNNKPARGAHWLRQLMKKPNPLQTHKQFKAQQNVYIDLFGYCPIFKVVPVGFEETGEYSSIWNLPPWLFDLTYTKKWLKQNTIEGIYESYKLEWEGETTKLDSKYVSFIFDDGIGTDMDSALTIPDSRLVGMEYHVSNIVAALKSRNTLITRRGAIGILSNGGKDQGVSVPMKKGEKDNLQKEFSRYGLTGQLHHVIITEANLQWQQMGYPTKDLLLFEETTESIERLCDAYGWPIELIARGKDVTYDNKIQARKDLYQNTIIPEADSRDEQFTNALGIKDILLKTDYSTVPVLQMDLKTKADARAAVNAYCQVEFDADLMTKNDWLEELGKPRREDNPDFDKYKSELTEELPKDELTEDEEDDTDQDNDSSEDSGAEAEE
jgi:hypothetical protein